MKKSLADLICELRDAPDAEPLFVDDVATFVRAGDSVLERLLVKRGWTKEKIEALRTELILRERHHA